MQREEYAHDRDMRLAWTVAALSRTQKLPKMETLFLRQTKAEQTLADHRRAVQMLSEQYGIPLQRREKRAG